MLWQIEIRHAVGEIDRDGNRVLAECAELGLHSVRQAMTSRSFLIEGELDESQVQQAADILLTDPVIETAVITRLDRSGNLPSESTANAERTPASDGIDESRLQTIHVLLKPGVTDNVGSSTLAALQKLGLPADAVATVRTYRINADVADADRTRLATKLLSNDAIERVVLGPLMMKQLSLGSEYEFALNRVPIREMDAEGLRKLSIEGQLYLQPAEMKTIRDYFRSLDRDPTDIELETLAQTWRALFP